MFKLKPLPVLTEFGTRIKPKQQPRERSSGISPKVNALECATDEWPHGSRFYRNVSCTYCQAQGGGSGFRTSKEEAEAIAIANWNRRSEAVSRAPMNPDENGTAENKENPESQEWQQQCMDTLALLENAQNEIERLHDKLRVKQAAIEECSRRMHRKKEERAWLAMTLIYNKVPLPDTFMLYEPDHKTEIAG